MAAAFAGAMGKPVQAEQTPRDQWMAAYKAMGFSEKAAQSYARMTAISLDGGFAMPDGPVKGEISLREYVIQLINGKKEEQKT